MAEEARPKRKVKHTSKFYYQKAATYARAARRHFVSAEHHKKLSDSYQEKAKHAIKTAERLKDAEVKFKEGARGRAAARRKRAVPVSALGGSRVGHGRMAHVTGRNSASKRKALRNAAL